MSKITIRDGRSGFLMEGTELTSTSETFAGGFCLIKAKGATSYFDTIVDDAIEGGRALDVDEPVYIKAFTSTTDNPLKEGDIVIPFDMRVSCWTTDCPNNASEGQLDLTSQCDWLKGKKDIRGDGNVTESGTISGYYDTDSEMQRVIESLFRPVIKDRGTGESRKVTYIPKRKDKVLWHFFIIRETSEVGEIETTLIRRMYIDNFSADAPSSGGVPFNFNYTSLASYSYEKEVTA